MGEMQDSAARGLIDAAGFHAYITVLNQVNPAHAVFAAQLVEGPHDAERVQRLAVNRDAVALLEVERNVFGLIRCVLRRDA